MGESIHLRVSGAVARITIERPPLNVLTTGMLRDLAAALDEAPRDERVRWIRLDAVGKVFSAGVDVADHVGDKLDGMMDALDRLFGAFEAVPLPTVAVVHGAALGGGCELVLGTDLCLASDGASFGQPEIRLGLFAPPASVLLPRLVGERRALGLLLTGETLPAAEAERIGLVNRVFPAASFEDDVAAWFERMSELSGSALRQAKRAVLAARHGTPSEARRRVDRLYLDELMHTADAAEGLQAFLDKRKPVWRHH